MRSHVDRYATERAAGQGTDTNGRAFKTTPLLNSKHNLQAALDSIRYIAMHVMKENEVREVSVIEWAWYQLL